MRRTLAAAGSGHPHSVRSHHAHVPRPCRHSGADTRSRPRSAKPLYGRQRKIGDPRRRVADRFLRRPRAARALAANAVVDADAQPRLRIDRLRPGRPLGVGVCRDHRAAAVHVRSQDARAAGDVRPAAAPGHSHQRLPGLHRRRLLLPGQPGPGRHLDHHPAHLRDRPDAAAGSRSSTITTSARC